MTTTTLGADHPTPAEQILGSPPAEKPHTFEELRRQPISCHRCGQKAATHALSVTVAEVGKGRGSTVTNIPRVPCCEQCAVDIYSVVKKALKA